MNKKTCKHCGYTWQPRIETEPKSCPYCKSPRWNEEKRKGGRPKLNDLQSQINQIIEKAIKEDWYNVMTTSDLQGVCEAAAMGMSKDFHEIARISDKILNGIYKHQEATK